MRPPGRGCSVVAETPFFDAQTNQIAANHVVSGVWDRWKIVPAVTDVWRPHPEHIHIPRRAVRHDLSPPQAGHTNPPGQRNRARYSRQSSSVENHATSC